MIFLAHFFHCKLLGNKLKVFHFIKKAFSKWHLTFKHFLALHKIIVGEGIIPTKYNTPQKNVLMNKKYELFLFPNPYFVRAWHAIYRSAWEKMGKYYQKACKQQMQFGIQYGWQAAQFLSEASFLTGVSLNFGKWAIGSGPKKIVDRNSQMPPIFL